MIALAGGNLIPEGETKLRSEKKSTAGGGRGGVPTPLLETDRYSRGGLI